MEMSAFRFQMTEIKDYITELAPQNKFTNLTAILEKIMGQTYKSVNIHKLNEDPWFKFLSEHKEEVTQVHDIEDLNELDEGRENVHWLQNSNFIQITLSTNIDEIKADETKIESPVLRGQWWGTVKNMEITDLSGENNPLVQIEFDVDCKWPLLIKGGNPDTFSSFFIAKSALDCNQFDIFEEYMLNAAVNGCYTAQKTMAFVMMDQKRFESCVHWLSRCILLHNDVFCTYLLCKKLLEGEGIEENAPLAEFMLCRLCIQNFTDAFFALGKLYLYGKPGVRPMKEKARFCLQKYVEDTFQEDDEDRQEAIKLLESEDFTQTEEEIQSQKEGPTEEEGKASIVDWALAGGVVAAAGAAGLMAIKRFFRH